MTQHLQRTLLPMSSTHPTLFQYDELPPDSIRLLHVESVNGNEIRCRFKTTSLLEKPEHYALTYVWGSADDERYKICVNDQPFYVLPNLHAALKAVHKYFIYLTDHDAWIWIDAVCIN